MIKAFKQILVGVDEILTEIMFPLKIELKFTE